MSRLDASTSLSQSYSSFSGVDIKAIINGKECGSIQHLSYMIQREKTPNYVMGSVDPVSFGRGKRGINGVIRGLLLDVDLLYSESFKNERALLDKDELFFLERIEQVEEVRKEYIAPKLQRDPDPLPSRYVWIWENIFKKKVFPGQSFSEGVEDCLKGAFEGVLQGFAVAAAGAFFGPLALIGVAEGLVLALKGCVSGVVQNFVYKDGLFQLAMDLLLCLPGGLYYNAYDDAVESRETLVGRIRENNGRAKPSVTEVRSMIENKIGMSSNYTLDHEYSLDNLGSNYIVNKVEYLDQILPFDIAIIAVNEYGQSAQMRLYGCEIMSVNSEFSIDSMTVPYSLNFTARAILPWRSFDLTGEKNEGAATGNEVKQISVTSSSSPNPPSSFGTGVKISTLNQGSLSEDEELDAADDLIDDDLDAGNDGIEEPLDSDEDGVPDEDDAAPFDPNIQ